MSYETIIRPNGKPYTPRKGLRQIGFEGDWESYVAVLGTHDIEKARAFATSYKCQFLIKPERVWVKSVMRDGEEWIATDAVTNGAAAVIFIESDDPEQETK